MGFLDRLASATGDKESNRRLVRECIERPALLHSIAEGFRTAGPKARIDCGEIMIEVAKRQPELLEGFASSFLEAAEDRSKRIAKLGLNGLALIVRAQAAEVFAARDFLLGIARNGGTLGVAAAEVLAILGRDNANYRGKLIASVIRLLNDAPDKDLGKWIKAVGPVTEGSGEAVQRLLRAVEPRLASLDDGARKRIERHLMKLERTTVKKKPR